VIRGTLLAVGLAALGYGGLLLLGLDRPDLLDATLWLAGGVLVHDGLLAPLAVLGGVLVVRALPPRWVRFVAWSAVVLGPVTLVAIPVLGRFGARPDNSTLLDRPYWAGWLLVVALSLLGIALGGLLSARPPARLSTRRARP
jgi:hypothetical protein